MNRESKAIVTNVPDGRKESEKCIQNIFIEIDAFKEDELECGVSLAEEAERLDPLPVSFPCFLNSLV